MVQHALAGETHQRGTGHLVQQLEGLGGVVVVRVEHQHPVLARELLRRQHRVRGAEGFGLHCVGDAHAPFGDAVVVVADQVVLGAYHQADLGETGVRQGRDHEVQEGAAVQGDHGLHPSVGGPALFGGQRDVIGGPAHA